MAQCKKCGKTLKVTNSIVSVKKDSEFSKLELEKGSIIVAIDGKTVNNKDEIDTAIKAKLSGKIKIQTTNTEGKVFDIKDINEFNRDINLSDDLVCSPNDSRVLEEKYGVKKGDHIVDIDGISVKNREDIEKIIQSKNSCKINIKQKNQTKTYDIDNAIKFINDIEFSDEETCSHCGKKQKNNILPIIIGIIALIIGGTIFALIPKNKSELKDSDSLLATENSNPETEITVTVETDVLPEKLIEELEKALTSNDTETQRTRASSSRTEVTYATDENGNLLDLRDTLIDGVDLKDGITINTTERNDSGSVETKTRTRRASTRASSDTNDSLASTLDNVSEIKDTVIAKANISDITEKLTGKVPFKYGSYLDMGQMSVEVEKYLLVQKLDEDKKEYASIILGLNDLIKKIPEDKKDSAVFIVMGYADTTLFNGIPEVSERSEKFNTELSWKRAESVKTILTGKDFGIAPEKVVTYGFGYSKNVNETTNLERFRRVDVVVSFK